MIGSICCQEFFFLATSTERSITFGVKVMPNTKPDDQCKWGYLNYGYMPGMRQRIVPLDQCPSVATEKLIECVSQVGEQIRLSYIDMDVWNHDVRYKVSLPSDIREPRTAYEVQEFLRATLFRFY
jgi:hypothetical protein